MLAANELSDLARRTYMTLSSGERQLIAFARATGRRDVPVAASGGDNVQKLAFALLIALIGYAALSGGG